MKIGKSGIKKPTGLGKMQYYQEAEKRANIASIGNLVCAQDHINSLVLPWSHRNGLKAILSICQLKFTAI